jgi:opacity protein-like surface antigen
MRALFVAVTLSLLSAVPSLAQTERGYVTGVGGFAASTDTTSGNVLFDAGVRVAPHLLVFGNLGQFHNLQPSDAEPAVDSTMATLSGTQGLNVIGTARVPALYSVGGVRYELPTRARVSPYVSAGLGFARLSPTAQFTYASGVLPDGSTPLVGTDVTSQLVTAGYFRAPPAENAFMYTIGTGVDIPVAQHWAVDVGYRFSRVSADTPLNAQGMTFGFGYRF